MLTFLVSKKYFLFKKSNKKISKHNQLIKLHCKKIYYKSLQTTPQTSCSFSSRIREFKQEFFTACKSSQSKTDSLKKIHNSDVIDKRKKISTQHKKS